MNQLFLGCVFALERALCFRVQHDAVELRLAGRAKYFESFEFKPPQLGRWRGSVSGFRLCNN